MSEIKKCIYAGDPSDEYCCACDGIMMVLENGEKSPATNCGGYQAPKVVEETVTVEPTSTSELIEKIKENVVTTEEQKPIVEEIRSEGITKEIQISSSVSKEVQGQWFKVTYSETRIIPEGANLENERKALWDTCNNEVDNQIKNLL